MRNDFNCSEYLHHIHGVTHSPAPHFDLNEEHALQETVIQLIREKKIVSAHDLSEGGLFVTLVESCMQRNLGFEITTDKDIRKDAFLFGEAQSRVVVSVPANETEAFEAAVTGKKYSRLGTVKGNGHLYIDGADWGSIKGWKQTYDEAIEKLMS
jgi:phosphoribosylformylglycinamidine synthase